jgi:DNA-binding transcriptional MerR regulator/effector-binding domain-containing protein
MFTIGELSRITGLTVKTLRFYHEKGLLVPVSVDPATGYRRYDAHSVDTARAIVALRALDVSLEEIGEVLAAHEDELNLIDLLESQKTRLCDRIRRDKDIVSTIDQLIASEKEAQRLMDAAHYGVEEKQLDPTLMAGIRMRGRYSDCGQGFARLAKSVGRWIAGKPFCLYYDGEYKEDDADFEVCFPVRKGVKSETATVRELPGGRFLSLLHRGPYQELRRSYENAFAVAAERGCEILLPTREVYIKGPGMIFKGNPKNYLTQILLPVRS